MCKKIIRHIIFCLCFVSFSVSAQKIAAPEPVSVHWIDTRKCVSSFNTFFIGTSEVNAVRMHLLNTVPNLNYSGAGLHIESNIESRTGIHLLFAQLHNGLPVYRGSIKVNMDKAGNILSVFDNTFSFKNLSPLRDFPDSIVAASHFTNVKTNAAYYFFLIQNSCIATRRIEYFSSDNKYMEALIDGNNNIVYSRDQNIYFKSAGTDSLVSALVFLPDPLTTAGVTYGGVYVDANDADIPQLNAERVSVNIRVNFSNDTFRLESPYVIIKDFAAPNDAPVISVGTPSFNYLRSHPGFENVNAFYHINAYQQYIRSLGFTNVVNYPIWVDTRGTLADNSFFSPGHNPPRLTFGIGGVDDAEDADVIIHEYGHAMSYSTAPNTNNGVERQALDEGNGDYFAASYSRHINPFNWQNVYSWDGHNPFWPGRQVISTKHYPEDIVNNIYTDAVIWSATMIQLWEDIGRVEADATLIESMYGYASNMTMEDAAALYIQADVSLYSGKNANAICARFFARGIFSNCIFDPGDGKKIHLYNLEGFSDGTGAIIRFVEEAEYATFTLFDLLGRKISVVEKKNINAYLAKGNIYPKGVYLLKVEIPGETASFKLINE